MPRHPRPSTTLRTAALAAAVAGSGWWLFAGRIGPAPHRTPELDRVEPAVRAAIVEQLERTADRPGDDRRHLHLGLLYEANGLAEDARIVYEDLAARRPDDPRVHYRLALVRLVLGDSAAAGAALRDAAALDPEHAPVFWRLGRVELEAGRLEAAGAAFERALALDPGSEAARFGQARLALLEGRPDHAIRIVDEHLMDGRHPVEAQRILVTALRQSGRGEDADRLAERLGTVAPEHTVWPDAWRDERGVFLRGFAARRLAAERLAAAGDFAGAVTSLEELADERPEDDDLVNLLAICLAETGRPAEAARRLERLIERSPGRVPPRLNLARLRAREGGSGRRAAIELVRAAIDLAPDHPQARLLLAELLDAADDAAAADAWLAAWRTDGRSLLPLERAAARLDRAGRLEEAAATCRLILRHEPAHGPAAERLAGILIDLDRPCEAAQTVAAATAAGGLDADRARRLRDRIERAPPATGPLPESIP